MKPQVLCWIGWSLAALASGQNVTHAPPFQPAVAQVLIQRCLECHAGVSPSGDINLTQPDLVARGATRDGLPRDSALWKVLEEGTMPPEQELPAAEKELLVQWLEQGAPWDGVVLDPWSLSTPTRAGRDWWALKPLRDSPIPESSADSGLVNPVDRFLQEALQRQGLAFSPPAEPRTQVRRLYFDLIGLPPSRDVIAKFEQDPTDAAWAALVDQLLASPEYGERWARHWLDVVRFGESDGFERNAPREHAWPYRDWVIQALNADLPYDQFARLQIAGDQLADDPAEGATATGFLVAGVHNTVVGSSKTMQLLARQDELEDLIGSVGQTFLGLTFNCARCHDHKYDPISQEEYYQLVATFAGVTPGDRPVVSRSEQDRQSRLLVRRQELLQQLAQLEKPALAKLEQQPPLADVERRELPEPVLSWDFLRSELDTQRGLSLELLNGARRDSKGLHLEGLGPYARSQPLPVDVQAKTLEVWVRLNNLEQRGGAPISLESEDGTVFDAIVFGEQEPRKWMAGSNGFERTRPLGGPPETLPLDEPLQFVLTYAPDGEITGYRMGVRYGSYRTSGPVTFPANRGRLLFGLRHSPPGGNRFFDGTIIKAQLYDRVLNAQEVAETARFKPRLFSDADIQEHLDSTANSQRRQGLEELESNRQELLELARREPQTIYTNLSSVPPPTHFLPRGDVTRPQAEVLPGTIRALSQLPFQFELPASATDAQRRVTFATWLTHPQNALFQRVIVNRLWQYHFGRGLVITSSDLGFNGGQASHPELLDWLAQQLVREGFRWKPLHRLMVTSRAYRQQSRWVAEAAAQDADNRWLWRKSPTRLEGEVLRDSMLVVSGSFHAQRWGPGFRDVEVINQNNGTTYYFEADREDADLNRRTIYRFLPRGGRFALLDSLDCPDPATAAPRRSVTTTPLQALSLLNSPLVLRLAGNFGDAASRQYPDQVPRQVSWMFHSALGRDPHPEERARAELLVEQHGTSALARALFNTSEFVTLD